MRLSCKFFARCYRLKAALFHNITYLSTQQSLKRIQGISSDAQTSPLVKRVTFCDNPFLIRGKPTDPEDTFYVNLGRFQKQINSEFRGRRVEALRNRGLHGLDLYVELDAIENGHVKEYSQKQVVQWASVFREAVTENVKAVRMHQEERPHHGWFKNLPNVECVVLSSDGYDLERSDSRSSRWASRMTYLYQGRYLDLDEYQVANIP